MKGKAKKMESYSVTTRGNLSALCIKHDWFTCGTREQYEKMFYANEHSCPIEEIATIIWLCSDDNWRRQDILSILIDEKLNYIKLIKGC